MIHNLRSIARVLVLIAFVASISTFTSVQRVAAQQTSAGSGMRVSPVRSDLTIAAGDAASVDITVKNVTSAEVTYEAIINDFIAGDNEYGQPALILDVDKYAPSHSLKRYIAPVPNLTIPAGESKTVKVTVSIPQDAAAGGYYGAIRFLPAGSNQKKNNISLAASVGSLILVKVPGDIKESMTLESFDVRSGEKASSGSAVFTSNKNLYAVARFRNNGNIHEQPFGKVVLTQGDKVLQTTEINNTTPKGNVLPDSVRRFSVKLDKVGIWGKYTVKGNFGYGSTGQLVSGSTTFYVIPLAYILGVIGLILLILIAIFVVPKAVKRYNQNVVRRANRRK